MQIFDGMIRHIEETDRGYSVWIRKDDGEEMIFHTHDGMYLIDGHGVPLSWTQITCDTRIAAVYDDNTPVMMSFPAQIGNAYGFVALGDAQIVCGTFDETLTDLSICLKLQMHDSVPILDCFGVPAKERAFAFYPVVVIYGSSTRSIPAITVPDCVILGSYAEK